MAIYENGNNGNGFYMPVAPAYSMGSGFGNGFGGFGGDGWWIILLLLCANGGWGFGGFGGMGGMMGMGMMDGMALYPWMNQSNQINAGFDHQATRDYLTGIQSAVNSGFGDVQNALCSGFAGTTAAVTGAQNAVSQQLYNNEIASLNRSFAEQTANTQGFNNVQAQLAQCCCDNRAATADLKYTVATENCADRTAAAQNTRDIIDAQTRGTQAILDKLCALELDGVKGQLAQAQRENVGLQNQLNMANLAASQTAQNTQIVDGIYNRLATCPVNCTPVYGNQPVFTCNNGGCSGTAFAN